MDINAVFPPEVTFWLIRYGLFLALCLFVLFFFLLLVRPFWLWFSGQGEALERLKSLEQNSRKTLLELEILNKTLSIPLKKGTKSAAREPAEPEKPLVMTQEKKEEFLRALEKSRMDRDASEEERE